MKKMTTMFEKDENNLGRVINKLRDCNKWVLEDSTIATIKFDGAACAIINDKLYKRYDAKINIKTGEYKNAPPKEAIPCQESDKTTGHHPHWVECQPYKREDKYFWQAYYNLNKPKNGTYELCGEKVNGNKHFINGHQLIKHGKEIIKIHDKTFYGIKKILENFLFEGIVFYGKNGEMCKIRKSDFGFNW